MMPFHVPLRRRQLVFGALTVLLHLLVFDWFSGQLGRRREEAAPKPPAPLTAQLIRTPPQVSPTAPSAPPSVPKPALRLDPPPLPDLAPEPVEVADAASGPEAAGAPAVAAGPHTAAEAAAAQQRATPGTADVQSQPMAAPMQVSASAPATPTTAPAPPVAQRSYKTDLPPQADIALDVARTDADGKQWNGDATLSWRRTASGYQVRVDAGVRVLFAHVGLLALTSEGTLGDEGFVPILMTERRRGRAMTATHFDRKEGMVTFSASQARVALLPGAQDKASLPLQLAAIGRGDPKQMSGAIDILVGEDRNANVFSFTVAGQEQIDTGLGRVATWHLVRPPKPGSYHSRLDVWLAPDYGWLPVRLRSAEANGAVTTQTARTIVMKETGSQ